MKTKNYKISESGYNPKIQLGSNSFSTKVFYENSATKNTTADIMKNRTIVVTNEIRK
ncbi:hypothetical protein [Bacteroides ovatus]|uniref:hypothetical protein n=1 Tax=Bacteroides ovatus TaxID=28116 RepID=UPI0015F56AC1|nr:hypothetical protein [Bacteroides ovatus]